MQQGVVDASNIEASGLEGRGYWDFATYWANWDIFPLFVNIMVNLDEWNKLPSDIQTIIWETAQEIEELGDIATIEEQAICAYKAVTKHQMTLIGIDPAEKEKLMKIGEPMYEQALGEMRPEARDLFELLRAYVAEKEK